MERGAGTCLDDEMKKKAQKELEEWDQNGRQSKEKKKENQGQKLTMSDLKQSRASFSNEKAVGIESISAEILKSIAWRALQKIRKAFELRYLAQTTRKLRAG